ncbi:MAG TPA: LuxR family transcriptional regulator [Acidimicrobiales bacterium]|nr:LuxR family transcriptional regulator [Acidimicrobiales bacterium]
MDIFVGRSRELSTIGALLDDAERLCGPHACLIVGPPGAGKTALVRKAIASATATHVGLVGHEPERDVALSAAMPLLRRVAHTDVGAPLDRVLFGDGLGSSPLAAIQAFELVHRALGVFGSIVLTVDDLQWVDDTSAALLHHLVVAADASGRPLTVMVASRPGASAGRAATALDRVLGRRFVLIDVPPLPVEDARELALRTNPDLADQEAAALVERAAGSPFWVQALARTDGTRDDALDLLRRRAASCSTDASLLLSLLAVWGRSVASDEIAAVTGWERQRVDAAAAELAGRGLIVESGPALALAHDLLRGAAAAETPPPLAARLQAAIAQTIVRDPRSDVISLYEALLRLRSAGAPTHELALRIATSPGARLLGREGMEQLAATAADAPDGRPRLELLAAVAHVASTLGHRSVAFTCWAEVAELSPSPMERARAALRAAEIAYEQRDSEKAKLWLERAMRDGMDDSDHRVRALSLESSILRWFDHRQAEAQTLSAAALELARRAVPGSPAHLVALRTAYDRAMMDEDPPAMLELVDEMVAARRGDGVDVLFARLRRAMALRYLGRYREARELLERLLDEATAKVLPVAMLEASFWLAATLRTLGALEEAEATANRAAALAAGIGHLASLQMPVAAPAHFIGASRRDWRAAVDALAQVVRTHPEPHHRVAAQLELLLLQARLLGRGHAGSVATTFAAAQRDIDQVGCARCRGELEVRSVEGLARVGLVEAALGAMQRWELDHPGVDPSGTPSAAWHANAQAWLAAAVGDDERAVAMFDRAVERAEDLDMRFDALWSNLDAAEVLERTHRTQAIERYRLAATVAIDIGAVTEEARAEQALRRLGVRTWRRGGGRPGSLTDREHEVARLAAEGATNPEIAAHLFLSRKTVERHVSNILAKLGVRNRTELAALLRDEGSPR